MKKIFFGIVLAILMSGCCSTCPHKGLFNWLASGGDPSTVATSTSCGIVLAEWDF